MIGLFTTLLSDEQRQKFSYPFPPIELFGQQLETAMTGLIGYLTAVRILSFV